MIKKTVTYTDFDGVERTENEFFDLRKPQPWEGRPVYIVEDAINFVCDRTGWTRDIVSEILEAEEDYMRSIGIIEDEMLEV